MRKRNRFLMDGRLGRTCDERMLPNIKEVIAEAQRRVDQLHSIYGDTAQEEKYKLDRDIYAKRILDRMETIDAVPVVHCKDCGYYEIGEDNLPYCRHPDGGISDYPQPDDFCSYGKRKWKGDTKDFAAVKNANCGADMREDEHDKG